MATESPTSSASSQRGTRIKKMSLKAQESLRTRGSSSDEEGTKNYFGEDSTSEEKYDTSNESSSDTDENSDVSGESHSEENASPVPKYLISSKTKTSVQPPRRKLRKNSCKYLIKSEDYFYNNSSKKNKTSNHTLDHLNTPRLSQGELQKLLSTMSLSANHKKAINDLRVQSKAAFTKWMCLLHEGFNILVYGLGSKRDLLNQYQNDYLSDLPVIVVNGYFPSLTMKDILDPIIVDILDMKENSVNLYEAADLIVNKFSTMPDFHLYLIIHNIEGEMLRANPKIQSVLAILAAIKNIHLIASIDHINAALIWDHNKISKFNFTWWDVTSLLPYMNETSFETSMMINRTGLLALSSLRNVFLSLTVNSKGIYLLIVKHQLQNAATQYYQGMLFKDLYWACREAFLVSSDLALRTQLTEFVDHKMVKFRRSADGAEYLVIPISNNLLQQFLKEQ